MESRLSSTTEIVHNPVLESAFVKIQDGRESDISDEEKDGVSALRKPSFPNYGTDTYDKYLSFAE